MKFIRKHKILSFIVVIILGLVGYIFYIAFDAYNQTPKILAEINSSGKLVLKLEDVPEDYQTALLSVEDPKFYTHSGIDLTTAGAGWTTITQGLVKACFFDKFSPGFFNKLNQSIIAIVFNNRVDKKTQLHIYINTVYLGSDNGADINGFQAGAQAYFGKDFSALSKDEFLELVAMIVAPNDLNLKTHPEENQKRVRRIKKLLANECQPAGMSDVYYKNCD